MDPANKDGMQTGLTIVSVEDRTQTIPIGELPMHHGCGVRIFFGRDVYEQILQEVSNAAPIGQAKDLHNETGGLLIGSFRRTVRGEYLVFVDGCLPVDSGTHWNVSISQAQFSAAAWEMRKRWPGMMLVGVYHSHPGHSIFHSSMDEDALGKAGGLLIEPWQFSMVIDHITRTSQFPEGSAGIFIDNIQSAIFGIEQPFPIDAPSSGNQAGSQGA